MRSSLVKYGSLMMAHRLYLKWKFTISNCNIECLRSMF